MQTTINLQEPYEYSVTPAIIILVLIIIIALYLVYINSKKEREYSNNFEKIPKENVKNISVIKGRFLHELDVIERQYENKEIELRTAYQQISEEVRLFVFEVTGIKAQNFSLGEIKRSNIPSLYNLIKEYYEPEFASKSVGDFKLSINKARSVIKKWN